jgi:hypothetical protein
VYKKFSSGVKITLKILSTGQPSMGKTSSPKVDFSKCSPLKFTMLELSSVDEIISHVNVNL